MTDFLSRDHIEMNIFDMFLGGVDTTVCTMKWALMYFIKWPETQQIVQEQLDQALGGDNDGLITLQLMKKLPYLRACIKETLRLASVLPFGVFHKSKKAATVAGYQLPKGDFFFFEKSILYLINGGS